MPNFSGIWTVTQQMQAKGASTWPAVPGAPTIGTATAGTNNCGSVAFTAPSCTGYPAGVTGYRVISTPGCFSNTGASSPIVVSGLTNGSSYTFKVQATNSTGYGALSAASNSITATVPTCAAYTSAGSYSWVAPTGVTSVAVVAVGGGARAVASPYTGGGGGELRYKNSISVTPGTSYTVVVGAGGVTGALNGGQSYFSTTGTVRANGGTGTSGGNGGVGDGGGNGGTSSGGTFGAGGGAGGYAGNGGNGGNCRGGTGASGSGGGGGGGGAANDDGGCPSVYFASSGGGGVGIYGQGSNGSGGSGATTSSYSAPGNGGSGGSSGSQGGAAYGSGAPGGSGGLFGGGGGGSAGATSAGLQGTGAGGAVRIVWAGGSRGTPSFPSTNVGP